MHSLFVVTPRRAQNSVASRWLKYRSSRSSRLSSSLRSTPSVDAPCNKSPLRPPSRLRRLWRPHRGRRQSLRLRGRWSRYPSRASGAEGRRFVSLPWPDSSRWTGQVIEQSTNVDELAHLVRLVALRPTHRQLQLRWALPENQHAPTHFGVREYDGLAVTHTINDAFTCKPKLFRRYGFALVLDDW